MTMNAVMPLYVSLVMPLYVSLVSPYLLGPAYSHLKYQGAYLGY
jgi:hypothetical protein